MPEDSFDLPTAHGSLDERAATESADLDAGGAGHRGLQSSCERYERLVRKLENEEPTEADFRELAEHEASCPSGIHSEAGVEQALGLPPGSLRQGSPEHGLRSPQEVVDSLLDHLPRPEPVLAD